MLSYTLEIKLKIITFQIFEISAFLYNHNITDKEKDYLELGLQVGLDHKTMLSS
jgi:hypothetical protein